eukprot:contig_17122_g4163
MATMHIRVEPVYHVTFRVCTTAREAWGKLLVAFDSESLAVALEMRRQLTGIHMKAGEPMLEYINRGTLLQYELGQLEQGPPEGDLVAAIPVWLPAAYDTTVMLLSGQETLTIAKVTDRLMDAEVRHKAVHGTGSDQAVAFGAMPSASAPAYGVNRREAETCTYCRCPGRGRWECRRLARGHQPQTAVTYSPVNRPQQQHGAGYRSRGSRGGAPQPAHRQVNGPASRGNNDRGPGSPPSGGLALMAGTSMPLKDGWIIDSGASHHITGKARLLSDAQDVEPVNITMMNGEDCVATTAGTVTIVIVCAGGGVISFIPRNVLLVGALSVNLFSIAAMMQHGFEVNFGRGTVAVTHKGRDIFSGLSHGEVLVLLTVPTGTTAMAADVIATGTWHRRFNHINKKSLQQVRRMVGDMEGGPPPTQSEMCDRCARGKQARALFPTSRSGTKWALD